MELLRNSTHLLDTRPPARRPRRPGVRVHQRGNEAVESLGADEDVDDAGGGGFVVMDDGTFVTVDCTVPRADSSLLLELRGQREGKLYVNNDDGEWRYWRLEDGDHVEEPLPESTAPDVDDDYERAEPERRPPRRGTARRYG